MIIFFPLVTLFKMITVPITITGHFLVGAHLSNSNTKKVQNVSEVGTMYSFKQIHDEHLLCAGYMPEKDNIYMILKICQEPRGFSNK